MLFGLLKAATVLGFKENFFFFLKNSLYFQVTFCNIAFQYLKNISDYEQS